MGEEFLSKQNEQFVHGRDRAHKELNQNDLLTARPEHVGRAFPCAAVSPCKMPEQGGTLLLADGGGSLLLMAEDGVVGTVNEGEAQGLRELMNALPGNNGMLDVKVLDTVDFLSEFTIRVSLEECTA
ncbi:hypothetical protein [Melittangium boletus]|uniref:hypothetical protein n=1 Tax=Melittangium boletus TaxID=83453 RepID=UPI003DA4BD06